MESNRPPAYWPSNRTNDSFVVVENLVVKYAPELPAVLHDVSFTLKAGERVGILGRTGMFRVYVYFRFCRYVVHCEGSGKSTLAMSMLRFVRISSVSPLLQLA